MMCESRFSRPQTGGLHRVRALRHCLAGAFVVLCLLAGANQAAADDSLCVGCHSDAARLDSLTEQPVKRLYVDPAQRTQDIHGAFECTVCHGGDTTLDSTAACVGVAHSDPTDPKILKTTCGTCHLDITTRYLTSIHNTFNGIHHSLKDLLGPDEGTTRFEDTCKKCHTSCSDCHLSDPDRRGLLWPRIESHKFVRKPGSNICASCHNATGDTFFGEPGNEAEHGPSVMAEAGMECTDCHVEREVHGTGTQTLFVMESPKPTCEKCHLDPAYRWSTDATAPAAPQFDHDGPAHAIHGTEKVSCVACHTQWYANCWNCHEGRQDRTVYDLFLANNPITGQVHTIVHSPASAPDWGTVPPEIGGEWAVKSRHSWGDAHTCEKCHTNRDVWVNEQERRAPFLGLWGPDRTNATYIDQALVDLMVIDTEKMKQDFHGELACYDCHASQGDELCADCHAESEKSGETVLPAEADWSRTSYIRARESQERIHAALESLEELGVDVQAWRASSDALRGQYLAAANAFHSAAGETQAGMSAIAASSETLSTTLDDVLKARGAQRRTLLAGVPLAVGALGSLAVGAFVYRPRRNKEEVRDNG